MRIAAGILWSRGCGAFRTGTAHTPWDLMNIHIGIRRVLALAGASAVLVSAVATAPSASAAATATTGLFGSADATYDGVYRQSMALLGLTAANAPLPATAVTWLTAQQCASGAFQSYRPDTSVACSAPDPAAFAGPDSNSTALGAMALQAAGRSSEANRAARALRSTQNADGGWGYTLGGASDVNSTGLSLAALKAFPATKDTRTRTQRAMRFLARAQLPCATGPATRFALPYQAGQPANALASVQGLLGIAGSLPIKEVAATSVRGTTCADPLVRTLSWHVDQLIRSTGGRIPSALDGSQTDWNATATGVAALASAGAAPRAIAVGIAALGRNTAAYVGAGPTASPAAAGTLIQAAVGAGRNPRAFGNAGTNLVSVLLGTLQR